MVQVGPEDRFEQEYRNKLKALLAPHGQLIEYSEDRVALDLGLHLYERPILSSAKVSQVRVWFQAKGIQTKTLPANEFLGHEYVVLRKLSVNHVRFWYGSPEPVYLAVYIEATDEFLVEDIRNLIDRLGGAEKLAEIAEAEQKEMALRVRTDASLVSALDLMPRHRSIRADGPLFRGRPLGHRYDPLRSEMRPLSTDDFRALVVALLEAHEFRAGPNVALQDALGVEVGRLTAQIGTLYLTYEWLSPMFTEFGYDLGSEFRIEAPPNHAQGEVLVVIHSDPSGSPSPNEETKTLLSEMSGRGVTQALVFFNASELGNNGLFGGWRTTLESLIQVPQGLGSLSFNVLTANLVYLEFVDRIRWQHINFL